MKNLEYRPIYLDENGVSDRVGDISSKNYSSIGFTHLLLNGFVPPPYTLFEGLRSVAPMDTLEETYQFSNLFPRASEGEYGFDADVFEEKFKVYLNQNVPESAKVSILFSGGKDSTTLALIFQRLRPDVRVKLFFLNNSEELERARILSARLNYNIEIVDVEWIDVVDAYSSMEYFCGDLSAPNYVVAQKAAEKWSPLIFDGSGNDLYSGHVPSRNDSIKYYLRSLVGGVFPWLYRIFPPKFRFLARPHSLIFTYNYFPVSSEILGLNKSMLSKYKEYWKGIDKTFKFACIEDYKVNTRGRFLDNFQIYTKTFCYAGRSRVLLPFCDKSIAEYLGKLNSADKYIGVRNKEYLRRYLNKHLDYESLSGGKQGMGSIFQKEVQCIYDQLDDYKKESKFVALNYTTAKKYPGWAQLLCGMCIWMDRHELSIDEVFMRNDI